MSEAKPDKTISESIGAIGTKIEHMTVAELAKEIGRSERGIKAYLTRHGLATKDYDGTGKKAKTVQAVQESSEPNLKAALTLPNAYQEMASTERESNNRWLVLGWVFAFIWLGITVWGFSTFGGGFFIFWLLLTLLFPAAYGMTAGSRDNAAKQRKLESMSAGDRDAYIQIEQTLSEHRRKVVAQNLHSSQFGSTNQNLICPHCQTKGQVRSKSSEEVTRTKVIPIVGNTIKARREVLQMHCDNCGTTWNV